MSSRPTQKTLLRFLLFACLAFFITWATKTFVMGVVHQNYRGAYVALGKNTQQSLRFILGDRSKLSKSNLDAANQNLYQHVDGPLPDLLLHVDQEQNILSWFGPKVRSQQLLQKLYEDILERASANPERDFFVSRQGNVVVVRRPLSDLVATYLIYFDGAYDRKDFYVTLSFLGAYASLLVVVVVVWTWLSRRRRAPEDGSASGTFLVAGPEGRTVVYSSKPNKQLLQSALLVREALVTDDFLRGTNLENAGIVAGGSDLRPPEYVLAYKGLFERYVDGLPLLKDWVERGFSLRSRELLLQQLVGPVAQLYPRASELRLYVGRSESPKQPLFFLACTCKNNVIECYGEGATQQNPFGFMGEVVGKKRALLHSNDDECFVVIPYLEDWRAPLVLQVTFPISPRTFKEQDFLFLRVLLRSMSEALANDNSVRQQHFHEGLGLLGEQALLSKLAALQQRTLKKHAVILVLLEPTSSSGAANTVSQGLAFGGLVQKHVANFLRDCRGPDANAYALGGDLFALLFSKPYDHDPNPLLRNLVEEVGQKPIRFFNQAIHLGVRLGRAEAREDEFFEPRSFVEKARASLDSEGPEAAQQA